MTTKSASWRPFSAALIASFLTFHMAARQSSQFTTDSEEQRQAIAEALKQHSYNLKMQNGKPSGPGFEFLLQQSTKVQFVLFGEEHFVKEFPEFLSALFGQLHQQFNFNYLALESDPVSARVASLAPLRGDLTAIANYARTYPNAFTFPSDQELGMIADVGRVSTGKTDAIWGLDQSFGVLHALVRLSALPGFHATPKFQELLGEAQRLDSSRAQGDDTHYLGRLAKMSDLEALRKEFGAMQDPEARFILDNLVSSSQIYGYYWRGRAGELTGYANGYEREEQMKHLFLREYRAAEAKGDQNPKVLLKLGHWHVYRGVGPSHLQTLGNFVTEFATANGNGAFSVAIYIRGPWRDVANQKGLVPIALATDPAAWTVIDFRALRPAVRANQFGSLDTNLVNCLYGFDAALVMGNASEGTRLLLKNREESPLK